MGVKSMVEIKRIEAFELVARAFEDDDAQNASRLLQIITKTIKDDKNNNRVSEKIVVEGSKEERFVNALLQKYGSEKK